MTRDECWALCFECKRLTRQSQHHTFAGFFVLVVNVIAVAFLHRLSQSWVLIPMGCVLMAWGDRELRDAKQIMDRLNAEVLQK